MSFRSRRFWSAFLGALLLASPGGCSMLQSEETNFRDDMKSWGEKNRPAQGGSGITSLSAEGRQVERNLGIR